MKIKRNKFAKKRPSVYHDSAQSSTWATYKVYLGRKRLIKNMASNPIMDLHCLLSSGERFT